MTGDAAQDAIFDEAGRLRSRRYDDVFASVQDGADALDESRHVFVAGNDLLGRLPGHAAFTIGETGFGIGLNFLAAWDAWRRAGRPSSRLTFVSTELHPLPADVLRRALAVFPVLDGLARELVAVWHPGRGVGRWLFDGGRVVLCVLFGDATTTLARHAFRADAWFLDGFAPARNPAMWSADLLRAVAEHSAAGATCATYSVAGVVRRGLGEAGFAVERRPGFGRKREMLVGRLRPDAGVGRALAPWQRLPEPAKPSRVTVVGAGIAGAAVARSLAERGVEVEVVDRRGVAGGASAQRAAMVQPRLGGERDPDAAIVAHGFGVTLAMLRRLSAEQRGLWHPCGVLRPAVTAAEEARLRRRLELSSDGALDLPGEACWVDRARAWELAGIDLGPVRGAVWLPTSGWTPLPGLCRALLDHPRITVRAGDPRPNADPTGCVVLADGHHTARRAGLEWLGLTPVRGQSTVLAADGTVPPRVVICHDHYLTPAADGRRIAGATYARDDCDETPRADDDALNRSALVASLPGLEVAAAGATFAADVGIRATTTDRLPRIGPVPDLDPSSAARRAEDRTRPAPDWPWRTGLWLSTGHGSRGAVTGPLGGEIIAAALFGEPSPLPDELLARLLPARTLLRTGRLPIPHDRPGVDW